MAQYQANLHSNRVNWYVISQIYAKSVQIHVKSILNLCKFRFKDEEIKLKFNQWDFLNTANHP